MPNRGRVLADFIDAEIHYRGNEYTNAANAD
jgi:hypothetical protein